jgi:hypothetical protein
MCAGNARVVLVEHPTLAAASLELTTIRSQLHESPHMLRVIVLWCRARWWKGKQCGSREPPANNKQHPQDHDHRDLRKMQGFDAEDAYACNQQGASDGPKQKTPIHVRSLCPHRSEGLKDTNARRATAH